MRIAVLRDRGAADLAQNKLGSTVPWQCSYGDKRAEVEARFGADNDRGCHVADQAAQAGYGIAQLSSRNLGDANGGIEQRPQRTVSAQRQNGDADADAFGGERVTEQDHVPLRAAALESAQYERERKSETLSRIFGPRCHEERRLSYWDYNRK